jgi:DNA polymerase-3 subunit epsilon
MIRRGLDRREELDPWPGLGIQISMLATGRGSTGGTELIHGRSTAFKSWGSEEMTREVKRKNQRNNVGGNVSSSVWYVPMTRFLRLKSLSVMRAAVAFHLRLDWTGMKFVAIDVETANADLSSICQIGIASFADGVFLEKWETLVDPEDEFDEMNVLIHGINESMVADAPKFPSLVAMLLQKLADVIVVSHTPFDQSAIRAVFEKYEMEAPLIIWLDSARVVRRTWLDLARRGYGLAPVAERLGIQFKHHNAAEDARAAGEIILHAIRETGLSLDDWLIRAKKPITSSRCKNTSEKITREGNPEGPLYGEVAVFTGTLSMPRREAADLAAAAGCDVSDSVSKSTTLLIVGDQDIRRIAGHEKSSKHLKAESLIQKGQQIRFLRETDFHSLLSFVE